MSNKKSKGERKQNQIEMHFTEMSQINRVTAPANSEAAKTELSVPGEGEQRVLRPAKSCWVLLTGAREGKQYQLAHRSPRSVRLILRLWGWGRRGQVHIHTPFIEVQIAPTSAESN